MKSIKTKLILYFAILLLLTSSGLGFLSIRTSAEAITVEAEKALGLMAADGAKIIESRIETQINTLRMLSLDNEIASMDWSLQQGKLAKYMESTGFLALGIVYPDGTAFYHDGNQASLGDREYVIKAFKGEANVSDVIISRVTNSAVLMYAAPIMNNGKVVGVLVGRRDGNGLSVLTDDMGFGEEGYAYAINSKGIVVAHPDREKVMEQFNPIEAAKADEGLLSAANQFTKMLEEKKGVSDYDFQGSHLYAGYAPIQGTNWLVVITADSKEVLVAIPALRRSIMVTTSIILVICIALCYLIGNSITKPIIATIAHSKRISELDITEDMPREYMNRRDEIGSLATSFQTITDSLRSFVRQISDTSQQVASSSEELTAISQQSATAAEEVARTLEEIAKGATDQAKDTEEGAVHVEELTKLIEKDQVFVRDLNTATKEINKLKDEGLEILKDLVDKTNHNNIAAQEVNGIIVNTNDSAKKIDSASEMIKNIADQTNLLALNAAIEAARAGEAGRGFAVVAEEIRKLAEQSNSFTEEIATIIRELTNKTSHAVNTMAEVGKIVASQTQSVELTDAKFKGINSAVEKMNQLIVSINKSGEDMDNKKDEIVRIIQNLSAISQQNAAGTEEASASVEEQTASMEEIANASDSLARLAEELQTSIARFKC